MKFNYINDKGEILTEIFVSYKENKVTIINHTDDLLDRAFGINEHPTMRDFNDFLESRCVPRTRDHLKLYLDFIGVDHYDPLLIIEKTKGRMAEDNKSLIIVEEEKQKDQNEEDKEEYGLD